MPTIGLDALLDAIEAPHYAAQQVALAAIDGHF
jgi:hypothetical protein